MSSAVNLILPYSVKRQQINGNLFIQIRILVEGGYKIWSDDLDSAREILNDCGLEIYKIKCIEQSAKLEGSSDSSLHLYEVNYDSSIEEYSALPENSTDLCWRTFYVVLKKSEHTGGNSNNSDNSDNSNNIYYHYLPVPDTVFLDSILLKNLFEYILKLSYNIIIE